jgi:hypothetical protein
MVPYVLEKTCCLHYQDRNESHWDADRKIEIAHSSTMFTTACVNAW